MRFVLLLSVVFTLSGCIGLARLPEPAAGGEQLVIKTVAIAPTVTVIPETPFVQTPGQVWGGAIGGLIGAAIASAGTPEERFAALLAANNIDLKQIVASSFQKRLGAEGSPITLATEAPDATLELVVMFYGIHGDGPFSMGSLEPMLEVGAKVIDGNGKHVRNASESLKFPSDEQAPTHTMEEYTANPQLLAEGYTALSDIIADAVVKQLAAPMNPPRQENGSGRKKAR